MHMTTRKKAPALLVAVVPWFAVQSDGGVWRTLAPLNLARQETGAAMIGNTVYVAGGLVPGPIGSLTNTVEAYDLGTNTWSFVASMPAGLHHPALAACGGKLYVAGGYTGWIGFGPEDTLWIYEPASDTWTAGASLPDGRGAAWTVEHDGKLYLFGGLDSQLEASAATFIYDPAQGHWSQGAPMPTAREHLNAVSVEPFLYVVGGRTHDEVFPALERYDPAANTWTVLSPMPTPRSAAAVASIGDQIYVAGGEVYLGDGTGAELFSVIEVYDIRRDQWTTLGHMPVARHGLGAIEYERWILMPGGATTFAVAPTSHFDAFRPFKIRRR